MTPAEADIVKTVAASLCGLVGAAVTAWAGVAMARLKRDADAKQAAAGCECPKADEVADAVLDIVIRNTGALDSEFWSAVRAWPRVHQAILGRSDAVGADAHAVVVLLPQIAARVREMAEHLASERREREIQQAAERLAAKKD